MFRHIQMAAYARMGFKEAKRLLIHALQNVACQHDTWKNAYAKNLLQTGRISAERLCEIVKRCQGQDHRTSPHHGDRNVEVHILVREGWYLKFYFPTPESAVVISVHQSE